jgi:hypothetical protein
MIEDEPEKKIEYRLDMHMFMAHLRNKAAEMFMVNDLPTISKLTGVSVRALQRYEDGILPPLPVFLLLCSGFDIAPGDYFRRLEWVAKTSECAAERMNR